MMDKVHLKVKRKETNEEGCAAAFFFVIGLICGMVGIIMCF